MNIEFESSFKPIENKAIKIFEETYNLNLPDDYKKFLLCQNGGKTVRRRFETNDKTITSSIMLFLPLGKERDEDLEYYYTKYNLGNIVPSNFVPIGFDPADSLICLSVSGEERESVYFCDMDYIEEDKELKQEFVRLISPSFSDFVNTLFKPN
ncbi:hypothetical protein BC351_14545 [Paenibacillus ferrarius]|uniref:Knr4/Smi1-like domain-containing protein n=1 Tax=Paenibacillus ferrarius TaxID=1469647 RepID=A0A1V4H6A0_9BACL|nr:SMI1/KNR4 family protein [Paenibacillus ferrarius]OPH46701.1 hypothetical protein BC351_14545 [Paenibacillus ferrarius]